MKDYPPDVLLSRAQTVKRFLEDDTIAEALSNMERKYYEEFVSADSSEKRIVAQAKAKVLRDLETEMNGALLAGEGAMIQLARDAKRAEQERKP